MDSERHQYHVEDADEVLAKTLELSRLEKRGSQRAQTQPTVELREAKFQRRAQASGPDLKSSKGKTVRKSQAGAKKATPLCLPNNCKWDSSSGQCIRTGEKRTSLYVVDEALENLRRIKGPVCVVSIAGTYRKGKSYVLSETFNQPQVFPVGHVMEPETIGIWLWIVPDKFRDAKGQEFTMVLLDSEGIDAATGDEFDDNQIFTLTVLLASVLIYNTSNVATRRDVEALDFIVKLSHRIEIRSKTKQETERSHQDSEYFHATFPFFIWLLRDVTQGIPNDCSNIKDYFLKKVFKVRDSSAVGRESQSVAESVLTFFSGFEAFSLPSPTVDPEALKSISDNKSLINPSFTSGLEDFRHLVRGIVRPKNSVNDGEFVTGGGLAALVQFYVQALNTPGMIPNVQNAWDQFVEMECSNAVKNALKAYDSTMTLKLPCDNDLLRKGHEKAQKNSVAHLMTDTKGISTNTIEKFLKNLKESLSEKFLSWQEKNTKMTRESCNNLLATLKKQHLDPALQQILKKDGIKPSFHEIIGKYNLMKDDFHKSAIGAKDEIEEVFLTFHIAMMAEKEQNVDLLQQLKDYDERLTEELGAKALQEQEKQKLEEQREALLQQNRDITREMKGLSKRQKEEIEKFREQVDHDLRAQREQMNNMMKANMVQAQKEREQLMQENKELRKQFLDTQFKNKEHIKEIQRLSKVVERQNEEKRREEERRRAKEKMQRTQAATEESEKFKQMEARHKKEKESLIENFEQQLQSMDKELKMSARSRIQEIKEVTQKLEKVEEELKKMKEPGYIKLAAMKVKDLLDSGYQKVKEKCIIL